MRGWLWIAGGLLGCASAAPGEPASAASTTEGVETATEREPSVTEAPIVADQAVAEAPVATEPTANSEPAAAPAEITIRLELEQPTIRRGAPRADRERLDAIVHVRNVGQRQVVVEGVLPLAHHLEWQLRAEDGTSWQPTFYPPPMPRPGGPPRRSVALAPGEEAPFCNLHGISGFQRAGSDAFGPLPSGRYQVVVSGLRLGEHRFAAPPVTLVVH